MKKLLLLFGYVSVFTANAQNGFTTYTTNLSLTGTLLKQTSFLVDNSGNKWIGFRALNATSNNVGLVKYDNSTWTLYNTTTSPALPTNSVTALSKDNSGNIWIGSTTGLIKYDGTNFTNYPSVSVNCIEAVGNQVYVGTNAGLLRFDGSTFTTYNVAGSTLPSDTVVSLKAETPNLIWLGGKNRIVEFNINGAFTTTSFVNHAVPQTSFTQFSTLSAGNINCIQIDSQNNKWLGTTTAGIVKYDGSTFMNANELYEISGSSIPLKVFDIAAGLQNGIVFKHTTGSGFSTFSGLTELAPNNKVYQYFHSTANYVLGEFIENTGTEILISQGGPSQAYSASKMYYEFDVANNTTPLGSVGVSNFKSLDINNVKAGISNRSDMHWDMGGNGNALYEVPKGSGKNSNFASALWIGGLDNGGQLHGGAQTYRQAGVDFWPGPLDTITATTNTTIATNYDKIWKVSYTDINNFITAYNTGSLVATEDIMTWPAHGSGNNSRNLAPFVDHNGDGIYNPNDGDYPKIKGDQTLYFIYNDNLSAHSTSFTPMGIEVQGMAYAYGCPSTVNGHNELTYTTFYDYKIINRSSMSYHDVYISMFSDADLGYYADDYIGSDVGDNYGYIYNADAIDETVSGTLGYGVYMPAQGFNIVKGPLANVNDGIDNNNNGITDEPGEDCKLNKFNYYNNSFPGVPLNTTDPSNGLEYYRYMTGYWKDGTPLTCGGNGYGGTIQTNYVYTADTYTNGVCGATPWFESSVPGDRRMILSSGPFTLNAGQMQEVEYAFVTSFDSSMTGGMAALPKLKSDIQKINNFYNQSNKPNCLSTLTGIEEEADQQNDFEIYPNPAKDYLNVRKAVMDGKVERVNYEVEDVLGKFVLSGKSDEKEFSVNISDLNPGIYFLRLQVNNSVVVKKFVKE
ncbi:MAG: T9SS type A sorting domain-containing protein [Bacteroidota bacterium]